MLHTAEHAVSSDLQELGPIGALQSWLGGIAEIGIFTCTWLPGMCFSRICTWSPYLHRMLLISVLLQELWMVSNCFAHVMT